MRHGQYETFQVMWLLESVYLRIWNDANPKMHDGNIEPSEFLHLGCEEHILEMRGEKQFRYHVVWQRK